MNLYTPRIVRGLPSQALDTFLMGVLTAAGLTSLFESPPCPHTRPLGGVTGSSSIRIGLNTHTIMSHASVLLAHLTSVVNR